MTATDSQPTTTASAPAATLGDVIALRERPPRPSPLSASMTFGWRAMLRIKHVPEQLFDVTAFPVMMTLMFTYLFGGAIAGSVNVYVQDVIPGILAISVVMITMYTGVALNVDIEKGVLDRFRSLPIWRPSVIVGALLGDAVRYTIASIVIVVLGLAIGFRPDGGLVGVLLAWALLLVFSFSVSWVWTLLGLTMRTQTAVMSTSMLFLFPLTFTSNVFVPPSTMPGWLQPVVELNPIVHLVDAMRDLMHGTPVDGSVQYTLIASVLLVAVFGTLTMRRFNSRS